MRTLSFSHRASLPAAPRCPCSGKASRTRKSSERRWNLRLKNGIDVRLPEQDTEGALAELVALDHDKKLMTRDVAAIDLRLPDRVTVRLSEAAAQARESAIKERAKARKGGAA